MAEPPSGAARRPRRRDPEGHRRAILDAARSCFAEQGYARATIRAIADRAGVTHGLVMRQFGTKEQLFLAAVPGHRELDDVLDGDLEGLPARVARAFVTRMESGAADDPMVATLRAAASNQEAAAALLAAMERSSIEAYERILSCRNAAVRVSMLGSQMIGVTFSRYIARTGPLAELPADELVTHLTALFHHTLLADHPAR